MSVSVSVCTLLCLTSLFLRCDDANPDTGADAMPKDDPYGSKVTTPLEYLYWLREQSQQRKSLDNADGEDSTYVNDEGK